MRRVLAVFALGGSVLFKVPPADLIPCGGTPPSPAGIPSGMCPTGNLPFQGRHGLRKATKTTCQPPQQNGATEQQTKHPRPCPTQKTASPFRKRIDKLQMNRLLGRWTQNAPASSAFGARRAVLGRKRLPLTPAAVCASPPAGYITAIAPILTKKPLPKTAA